MRSSIWGTAVACALLLAVVPAASAGVSSEGITVETSAGPVSCAVDSEHLPGAGAISLVPLGHGFRISIREAGALRCVMPMFGEVEVTPAGLPWNLTVNAKRLTARLTASPKPALLVQPVAFSGLSCLYQAGSVLGTLTPGDPPSVSLTVARVRLNPRRSSPLCPALGPLDLGLTL